MQTSGREGSRLHVHLNNQVDLREFIKYFALYPKLQGMRVTQLNDDTFGVYGNFPTDTRYDLQIRPGIHFNGWGDAKKSRQPQLQDAVKLPRLSGHAL